jgi:hypothetical protein
MEKTISFLGTTCFSCAFLIFDTVFNHKVSIYGILPLKYSCTFSYFVKSRNAQAMKKEALRTPEATPLVFGHAVLFRGGAIVFDAIEIRGGPAIVKVLLEGFLVDFRHAPVVRVLRIPARDDVIVVAAQDEAAHEDRRAGLERR